MQAGAKSADRACEVSRVSTRPALLRHDLYDHAHPFVVEVCQSLTSRASAALAKLASAAGGKASGADVALSLLLGLTPLHIDAHKARIRKDLDAIEAALEKLDAAGLGDSQRARELRTLKGRKRRELQGKS